jgi:hypothetical protein
MGEDYLDQLLKRPPGWDCKSEKIMNDNVQLDLPKPPTDNTSSAALWDRCTPGGWSLFRLRIRIPVKASGGES